MKGGREIDTTSPVINYYNQMTFIEDQFDAINYVSSFKYSRYGLLLAYALNNLDDSGIEFQIVSGYNKNDPDSAEFKSIKIQITKGDEMSQTLINQLTEDERRFYNHEFDLTEQNRVMHLLLL